MRTIAAIGPLVLSLMMIAAQAQTPAADSTTFEKKNYNYSEWTKGLFSEVVTVTHPGKMIFLAGVGAEDESAARGTYPSLVKRRAVLSTHIKLAETIAEGDVDRARRIAGRHLADTQTYVLSGRPDQRIYALSPQALSRPRDIRHS